MSSFAIIIYYNGVEIFVPINFHTDEASIPKILGSFYPRPGRYSYPAVMHDYLYYSTKYPRNICDRMFREAMKSTGTRLHTRWIFWLFVRMFGGFHYGRT